MKPEEKKFILRNIDQLISNTDLKSGKLLTILLQSDLTEEEKQSIESNATDYNRSYEFYRIMQIKENGLMTLVNALELTKQTQAAAILKSYFSLDKPASANVEPNNKAQTSKDKETQTDFSNINELSAQNRSACKAESECVTQLSQIIEKLGKDFVIKHAQTMSISDSMTSSEVKKPQNVTKVENVSSIKCPSPVNCFQYDETKIISGHEDGRIRIWDLVTLQCTHNWNGLGGNPVISLQCNDNIIVSGGKDKIQIWDINTHELISQFEQNGCFFSRLKLVKNNIVALERHDLKSFNIQAPTDIYMEAKTTRSMNGQALDADDEFVISVSDFYGYHENSVRVWRFGCLEFVKQLIGHGSPVYCVYYHNKVVISADARNVRLWNVNTGEFFRSFSPGDSYVICVACNDTLLVTGHQDGKVRLWEMSKILNPDISDLVCYKSISINDAKIGGICIDEQSMVVSSGDRIKCFKFF